MAPRGAMRRRLRPPSRPMTTRREASSRVGCHRVLRDLSCRVWPAIWEGGLSRSEGAGRVGDVEERARTAVTIRKAGTEIFDLLKPLWLALHDHHQSVAPPAVYQPDERSWHARRAAYEQWLAAPGSFVLVAERGNSVWAMPWCVGRVPMTPGSAGTAWPNWKRSRSSRRARRTDWSVSQRDVGARNWRGWESAFSLLLANADERALSSERRGLRPVMTYLARFAAESKPG